MKNYLKETWYMYTIVFVLSFMLFLYEPLLMYLGNVSDFWFGISLMLKMTSLLFLIFFVPLLVIFNVIYFFNKDKSKKIFKICTMVMFVVFLCSYIQGNYLVGNLPLLDGEPIEWSSYAVDGIISIVLWIVVIVGVILITKKASLNKMVKYAGFISLGIFVMLSLSLTTVYLGNNENTDKDFIPLVTEKNLNTYSNDKNFIIFLLDCVDSQAFMKRLNMDNSFKNMLNDFTYYPDTMSGHLLTTESIPLILTGKYYENEKSIVKWSTEAYKESKLFELAEKNDYELEVYEENLLYNDKSASRIINVYNRATNQDDIYASKFFKAEIKYVAFRYLPFFLKKFSKIEKMNFKAYSLQKNRDTIKNVQLFKPDNDVMYENLQKGEVEKVDNKILKFIHLDGAHVPFTHDKNFNVKKNATYEDEIDGSLTITKKYLEYLKDNKMYDNSVIIIMADHGYKTEYNGKQRKNPIFFVKGLRETHKEMKISDKPIHYIDLADAYEDLFAGKKSNELFANISNPRIRRFLTYADQSKETMIEYETEGKAWETEKEYKTGKEYRKKN